MPAPKAPNGYITIAEAARRAGMATSTMYKRVVTNGEVPCLARMAGARTFYYVTKNAVSRFMKKEQVLTARKDAKLYEIVSITLGNLDVLYSTESLKELSRKYTHLIEHDNKFIRLRVDGEVLTIHESDRIGYAYHSRFKSKGVYYA